MFATNESEGEKQRVDPFGTLFPRLDRSHCIPWAIKSKHTDDPQVNPVASRIVVLSRLCGVFSGEGHFGKSLKRHIHFDTNKLFSFRGSDQVFVPRPDPGCDKRYIWSPLPNPLSLQSLELPSVMLASLFG